jgi:alkanesulfonate monooxygenase SsuD/methylene tetrahydromethanopterin reductase-like flavin-dependent oxidoreductase (luciferase family)
VHVGAAGERALKNTALIADGWAPIALRPEQLREELKKLKRLCDEAGRDFAKMEITVFSPAGSKDPHAAVAAYREAGAHRLVLFPPTLAPGKADRELADLARAWIV